MPHDYNKTISEALRIRIVIGLFIGLFPAIWLAIYRNRLLFDPDTWWHVKVGSDIWSTWQFPTHDTYSYTFLGQPWIAKEWLSQLILSLSYSVAGWNGVIFITSVSIFLLGMIIYFILSRHLRPLMAASITIPALFLSSPTFLARPHIFTLALIVIWGYLLFDAARRLRTPNFGLLGILILWANLHAGFTLGFVIAFFAFLDFLERSKLKDKRGLAGWLLFLVLCPAVTLLNPYTYHAALMTLNVAGPNEAMPFINEWRPFNARDDIFHEAALLLMIYMLLVSRVRFTFSKSLFIIMLLYMFLTHLRFSNVFFTLTPVVLAADLEAQFPALSARKWSLQDRDPLERTMARSFAYLSSALTLAIAGILLAVLTILPVNPDPSVAATGAIAYAKDHKLSGHVLNGYNFGGPLIFNGIATYLDGRTDQLFLNGFTANNDKMQRPGGEKLLVEVLRRYDVQWTLLGPDDPRVVMLDALKGWKRSYTDEFAVIHVLEASPQ